MRARGISINCRATSAFPDLLMIAADNKIPYGEVDEIMSAARAAGAGRVGLMVKGAGS
jgi:biopolymer transport protein ExbD